MEKTFDYKNDIINTRVGCLGSSDGKLIAQVANSCSVSNTMKKRLAVVKGLIQPREGIKTRAMVCGDIMENLIYENLKYGSESEYESNPLWVSEKYSRKNVKLISHPDIVHVDNEHKVVDVYEVKTTTDTFDATRQTYYAQLYIHWTLACEKYPIKNGWNVNVHLVHYSTKGMNLDEMTDDDMVESFDPTRISRRKLKFTGINFDIQFAMDIIDKYLDTMDVYYEGDEIDADLLPANVKEQFDKCAVILSEIKEREEQIESFKAKLYDFLVDKEIKCIKNDDFIITRVEPSESHSFDSKRFIADYTEKYPRKARKMVREYDKVTKRKGFAKVTLR